MGNIGDRKMFALIVDSVTGEPRRLIDTSDDKDDSYLLAAEKVLQPDEVMHKLAIEDYPVRMPYVVAEQALGYKPVQEVVVPAEDVAAEAKAVSDMAPLRAVLSKGLKDAIVARAKEVFAQGKLPRFDPIVRQMLANEMQGAGKLDVQAALSNGAKEAPYYIAEVVKDLLPQIEAAQAVEAEAVNR